MREFHDEAVARVFAAYPTDVRERLLDVREMIFLAARQTPGLGQLEETLKWQQPSYLTSLSRSGTTIRIDAYSSIPSGYAIFFHCQTSLVGEFKKQFGTLFEYEDNRALLFSAKRTLPRPELNVCLASALTYHLRKRN